MFDFHLEDAEDDVIGNRVLVFCLFQQAVIGFDGALFAFDVLFKHLDDVRVIRGIVPAVGELVPVLWFCYRGPAQLDNPCGKQDRMPEFLGCMKRQLGNDGFLVGPADNFGSNPVLVIREPFIGKCLVEEFTRSSTSVSTILRPNVPMGVSASQVQILVQY